MPAWLAPLAGAAIAGGLSLIGGRERNRAQREMAREQMAFQERMSNTAYQRAVEDMRLAGINPILAYQQGGASSPGGAMAQIQDVISPAVSSAKHAARLAQEVRNMRAVEDRDRSQANTTRILGHVASEDILNRQEERKVIKHQGELTAAQLQMTRAMLPEARNRARVASTRYGRGMTYLQRLREAIFGGGIISPINTQRN